MTLKKFVQSGASMARFGPNCKIMTQGPLTGLKPAHDNFVFSQSFSNLHIIMQILFKKPDYKCGLLPGPGYGCEGIAG